MVRSHRPTAGFQRFGCGETRRHRPGSKEKRSKLSETDWDRAWRVDHPREPGRTSLDNGATCAAQSVTGAFQDPEETDNAATTDPLAGSPRLSMDAEWGMSLGDELYEL